jgi:hypothetical protein
LKKNHDGESEWLSESWLQPVLGVVSGSSAPATEVSGDRYILTGASFHANWDTPAQHEIVEFNGTSWIGITAVDGMRVVDKSDDTVYYFNTIWNQSTDANTNLSTTDLTQSVAARTYDIDDNAVTFEKTSGVAFLKIDANNSKITSSAEYTEFNGQAYSDIYTLTDAATITPDFINGNVQAVTLGDNRAIANPSNIKAGATYIIILVQDGTGSRTITSWGSNYKFSGGTAPTLTTTGGQADVITLVAYTTSILMCTSVLNFATS